jgi:hypothetical protein
MTEAKSDHSKAEFAGPKFAIGDYVKMVPVWLDPKSDLSLDAVYVVTATAVYSGTNYVTIQLRGTTSKLLGSGLPSY